MVWLAVLLFLFTLVFVLLNPRGLGIGFYATIGAVLALAVGVIHLSNIATVWGIVWDATLAFLGIIIISMVLDEAGLFHWAAVHVARLAKGDARLAFLYILLLGAITAALFANDGAALILTPIVFQLIRSLGFSVTEAFPYVLASGFIADTASIPFVTSNLVNILAADYFHIGFISFALMMVLPFLVSTLTTLALTYIYFQKNMPKTFDSLALISPKEALTDPFLFRFGLLTLVFLLIGYGLGDIWGWPISFVTLFFASLLLIATRRHRIVDVAHILRQAPWQIVLFSLSMYLVVYGLHNVGLTSLLASWLQPFTNHMVTAVLITGFLTAISSAVMNNLPSVLISLLAIKTVHATSLITQGMVYATVIGSDLGPKLTPIGSLATLLWLHVLAKKGIKISLWRYLQAGLLLTPPILLMTLLALLGSLRLAVLFH